MNIDESKSYLSGRLPGYTIRVEENYKGQPNNRYVFTKDGVDAAMLFARSLSISKEFLDQVVAAVLKRFNSPKADEKIAEKKLDAEESKQVADEQSDGPEPTELELKFYNAAKELIKEFESKYPMT